MLDNGRTLIIFQRKSIFLQLHRVTTSRTQYELKGSKQTLMEAFYKSTYFKIARGTSYGVSYDRRTQQPF